MPAVVAQNGPEIARLRPAAAGIERRRPSLAMNRRPDRFISALMRSTIGAKWKAVVSINVPAGWRSATRRRVRRTAWARTSSCVGVCMNRGSDYLRWYDNGASRDAVCATRAWLNFGVGRAAMRNFGVLMRALKGCGTPNELVDLAEKEVSSRFVIFCTVTWTEREHPRLCCFVDKVEGSEAVA
nr:hypothetical protein [Methylosinus sp. sav-2]